MPLGDVKLLFHMLLGPGRSGDHRERMERLYHGQAAGYDAFRDRFLHGRNELYSDLELTPGSTLVELGGGTARNLEFAGERLSDLGQAWVVDISPSMLAIGRDRAARLGWRNVELVAGDATRWDPPQPVDTVVFSYSLSMIPEWAQAVDNALAMLKPGGTLAVVDFLDVGKRPGHGLRRRSALYRAFWRTWFGHNDVSLNPDHLDYLADRTHRIHLSDQAGPVPYLPLLKVPYYRYLGVKVGGDRTMPGTY